MPIGIARLKQAGDPDQLSDITQRLSASIPVAPPDSENT
jgi:hypothetical protein